MGEAVSAKDVSKHNTPEDLWIVVDGEVYDMTEFTPEHPGGAEGKFENISVQDRSPLTR